MAKIISANGTVITSTSNPNIAAYSKKYGDWVEVLANGGYYCGKGIRDSSGNLYVKFPTTAGFRVF